MFVPWGNLVVRKLKVNRDVFIECELCELYTGTNQEFNDTKKYYYSLYRLINSLIISILNEYRYALKFSILKL